MHWCRVREQEGRWDGEAAVRERWGQITLPQGSGKEPGSPFKCNGKEMSNVEDFMLSSGMN